MPHPMTFQVHPVRVRVVEYDYPYPPPWVQEENKLYRNSTEENVLGEAEQLEYPHPPPWVRNSTEEDVNLEAEEFIRMKHKKFEPSGGMSMNSH
ncbi:hypothetical protein SAY86_001940 [Trapa natans]|uniref:Uncharacterized protein n=1 Tax=Trapa natans TaxID=22666 RepID=A0AAN7R2U6_TRANT|nr:hypothetical protein SAY86_001940 [Trapa natans]